MRLVKAQRPPRGIPPVVGVGVGMGGQRGVAQLLHVAHKAVGVVEVQPVEGGDAGHQHHGIGGEHLILAGVGAAAHMGADGVAQHGVAQTAGDGENVRVRLQVGHQREIVKALGQDHHDVGVLLFQHLIGGADDGTLGRGGIGVALRLDDGVHQQRRRLDGARQIAVFVVGVLPRPAVGFLGLDGAGAEIADVQNGKDARRAAQHPDAPLFPVCGPGRGQPCLHPCQRQHRQIQQCNHHHRSGDVQRIAAHDLGGGAQIEHVLRHQRRAMQVAGIVVHQRQHGEHRAGDAGGAAPAAQQGEQRQREAEGGERVERRVQRPLSGEEIGGDAVRQFQLIPRHKGRRQRQQGGQHAAPPALFEGFPVHKFFIPIFT